MNPGKRIRHFATTAILVLAAVAAVPLSAVAANKYSSGDKTWDTTTTNWGTASGGPYNTATWDNSAPDSAFFEGTGGTVTLGEAITAANITFSTDNYTIDRAGNTFTLNDGGTITANGTNILVGSITGSNTGGMTLTGTGSATLTDADRRNGGVTIGGTGTWTIDGTLRGYSFGVNDGVVIVNGSLNRNARGFTLGGNATLHHNSPNAVTGGNNNDDRRFSIGNGARIDNSSGAPVVSTAGSAQTHWNGDWTFIGSQGANSDLQLGPGEVRLTGARTVTVEHPDTTLTIRGHITQGGTLTKAGPGTLRLNGNNTYTGGTIANEGMLDVRVASGLGNSAFIQIDANGTLRLRNADNGDAAWDFAALSALNANLFAGLAPATVDNFHFNENEAGFTDVTATIIISSTAYWDGTSTTGDADGGSGTWDYVTDNWRDAATGGNSITWDADDTGNDTAVFGGTGGKVELGAEIVLNKMEINATGYQIGGDTETQSIHFDGASPTITLNSGATITAGITGSPAIVGSAPTLAPTAATMTIGPMTSGVTWSGTTTGNTVASIATTASPTKTGAGTWTVLGNSYSHPLSVSAGTLIFQGNYTFNYRSMSLSGGTLVANGNLTNGHGSYPLSFSGGTLSGTGRLAVNGSHTLTVPAAGTIAPGFPTGTFTVGGLGCTINGNLDITIDGTENSTLAVNGTLTISSATLNVNEVSAPSGPIVIATYTTLVGDEFAEINGADRYEIDYNYEGGNAIALVPITPAGTVIYVR